MAIHAKFSIPVACLVFAVIALALGLRVSRDGKLGGFVVGIGVIFAYYIAMFLPNRWPRAIGFRPSGRAGCRTCYWGHSASWPWSGGPGMRRGDCPSACVFRNGAHPHGWPRSPTPLPASGAGPATRLRQAPLGAAPATRPGVRPGVVLVVRMPRLNAPMPSLIDRYISRLYLRVAGLSFLALLGLFYISTFIDRSDKIFKGQATTAMIGQLLILLTPQFIYYVIPIAALLSVLVTYGLLARTSELTVMKACGISLYRTALSVVVLSLAISAVLFGLEQRLMASANRQAEALDARIRGRQPGP